MTKAIEFTESQLQEIYLMNKEGISTKNIGKNFNVGPKPIQRVLVKYFNVKFSEYAQVGDIIRGWLITDIYLKNIGSQNIRIAKIKSVIPGIEKEEECHLTYLTNEQINRPDYIRSHGGHNKTHNESKDRLYRLWGSMRDRTTNHDRMKFSNYAKLNIRCCEEWYKYENFRDWALANCYSEELTLDRIDPTGDYCPENCRWATRETQASNKIGSFQLDITAFGETKSIYDWVRDDRCKVSFGCLKTRLGAGWDHEKAITQISERSSKKSLQTWCKIHFPEIYRLYKDDYHLIEYVQEKIN